jgi:hypothetical protein
LQGFFVVFYLDFFSLERISHNEGENNHSYKAHRHRLKKQICVSGCNFQQQEQERIIEVPVSKLTRLYSVGDVPHCPLSTIRTLQRF